MPVYEYVHIRTGKPVEFVVPIHQRDQVPGHKRITVPRRLNVVLGAPEPAGPDCAVPKALKELEGTQDHRKIAKEAGFTTQQLKTVWGI